jgi:hypothetical protein
MRSAYFPMNSLGTLGRPGESLVPVVGQHGMRAGGMSLAISVGLTMRQLEVRVLGFPATSSTCRRMAREACCIPTGERTRPMPFSKFATARHV